MKCKVLSMTATLVVSSLLIGCSTATERMDFTPVSVRFVMPPEPEALAETDIESEARLATDASYDGFADPNATSTSFSDVYHVALWGDAFRGHDVTRGVTSLHPGAYTFAFVDREHQDMMQGWLETSEVDAVELAKVGLRIDVNELSEKKGYSLERVEAE